MHFYLIALFLKQKRFLHIAPLHCIEHCTKWVELIPLPSKASVYVAWAFLENVISRYGAPGEVLTNQGTEFQGEFHTLLSEQEITHRVISRDNLQADGLAERMVQTLKQSLRKCLLDQNRGMPYYPTWRWAIGCRNKNRQDTVHTSSCTADNLCFHQPSNMWMNKSLTMRTPRSRIFNWN